MRTRIELPQPFLVIATQNPVEHHGTYPLPESQLDRFLMRVRMGYPEPDAEREILRAEAGAEHLERSASGAHRRRTCLEMQQAVTQVRVDESLVSYALEIVQPHARIGESVTGSFSARIAGALPRRAGHGLPRRPHLLHARRFQAVRRPRLCPSRGRQRPLRIDAQEVRAVRRRLCAKSWRAWQCRCKQRSVICPVPSVSSVVSIIFCKNAIILPPCPSCVSSCCSP